MSNPVGRSVNNPARFTFRKAERLCSRRLLDGLFKHGAAFNTYPLRFVSWRIGAGTAVSGHPTLPLCHNEGAPVKVVLTVSKRYFKHAHDRNRIKRQLREAWRHHKHWLAPAQPDAADSVPSSVPPGPLLIGVLYIGREKPESLSYLSHRLRKGLDRLRAELPGAGPPSRL